MSENIKITLTPATVQQIQLKTGPTTIVTGGGGGNSFGVVNVAGQNNITATTNTDILRVVAGSGISLTTDSPNNQLTVTATGGSSFDQFARDTANDAYLKANTANVTGEAAFAKANVANTTADASIVFGQAAFNKANTANVTGQAAFDKANTANTTADASIVFGQAAFTKANTANITGEAAFAKANVANTTADASIVFGQAAFNKANTANVTGEAAFAKANTANTTADASIVFGQAAFNKANTANVTAEAAFANANNSIKTSAQIRANLSNTAPINYDPSTGIISAALSGAAAAIYGGANTVPVVTVDTFGRITLAANSAVNNLNASTITSGNLVVARGGTGLSLGAVVNGQILIGNTVNSGFDLTFISNTGAGGIIVSNDKGIINLTANLVWIRGNISATTPIVYTPATGVITHATSGVGAAIYGGANTVPVVTVDTFGHITLAANSAVNNLDASTVTTGNLVIARGGTGRSLTGVTDGQLLIGNTTNSGFDLRTLTQGTGILITNGPGTITIDATGGSAVDQYARDKANGAVQLGYPQINVAANATLIAATTNNNTLILIQGSGILLTPNAGNSSIVISATGGSAVDQYARDKANGAVQLGYPRINVASNATLVAAATNNDILILLAGSNVILESNTAQSSITINSFDQYARDKSNTANITAEAAFAKANVANTTAEAAFANANNSIKTSAQIRENISNTYPVYYNATTGVISFVPATANGQILIGNTVSGNFDLTTISNTGAGGIIVSNDKGIINLTANLVWIRGNISATTPIVYTPATGVITHATSGVGAAIYGGANTVPVVTVDTFGHITLAANSAVNNLNASTITSGNLVVARGGTGLSLGAITNGQILIGNTVNSGFDLATISNTGAGGIIVSNDKGIINLTANLVWIRGNISATTPIVYTPATGVITHATSGVSATIYGGANTVPVVTVDTFGHVTLAANSAINNLDGAVITTGNLVVARGGTGRSLGAITNGQILIGNTVNSGFDLATISNTGQGGIIVSNDKGIINLTANLVWIRGNISATAPIAYDATTGIITHAVSGVAATIYGGANTVPVVTVDTFGHVTLAANSAINNLNASTITSGNLVVARGGTGLSLGAVTNGQILIGNTVNSGFDLATISNTGAGGIIVSNDKGIINLTANLVWIRGNISATTPIVYTPATGVITHAVSGVAATIYGGANTVPVVTVDTFGHITLAANSAINNLDGAVITTGNLVVARGGTGRSLGAITNGQILIGNTVNSGFDLATISNTGVGGIIVSNDKGIINLTANLVWIRGNISATTPIVYTPATGVITHATSGVSATIYGGANTVPVVTVDTFGHITLAANSAINNLDGAVITTGNLVVARGGTGRSLTAVANGQLLIGNTTNSGFDLNTLTAGNGMTITNGNGTITLIGANNFGVINIGGTGNANVNPSKANDTLQILQGSGISITTDATNKALTINATGGAAQDQFARDTANSAWLQANTANAIANSISAGTSFGKIHAYVVGYGITMQ